MLIFTLAAAMTLTMLVATAISLYEESQRARVTERVRVDQNPFHQ